MGILIKIIIKRILFLLLFFPQLTAGQSSDQRSLPVLNDHYFTPNLIFLSPFINTFFKTGIGGGASLSSIPIYTNNGEELLGTLEGENTFIIADIHAQIEVREWLGAWFRFKAAARIGSSTPTAIAHGVTSTTAFEFGWMLRLYQSTKSQLSASLGIENANVSAINILSVIRGVIDNPDTTNFSLSKTKNPLYGRAGLRFAYAFNDIIGIRANISSLFGESILSDKNAWKFNAGILGSFNFTKSYNVPVSVNLGYLTQMFTLFEEQIDEKVNSIMFKLAYTGREDYNIGLEINHVNTTAPLIKGENHLEYVTTTFVLVYFF